MLAMPTLGYSSGMQQRRKLYLLCLPWSSRNCYAMTYFDFQEQRITRARYLLEAAGWDKLDERAEAIARTPFEGR